MIKDLLLKCAATFVIQISLSLMIVSSTGPVSPENCPRDLNINLARFICGYLLHFETIPEIRTGLQMMQYAKNYKQQYINGNETVVFFLGLQKFSTTLITEIVCINTIL